MYVKTIVLLVFLHCSYIIKLSSQNIDGSKERIEVYLNKLKERSYFEAETDSFSKSILPSIESLFEVTSKLRNGKVFTIYSEIYGSPFLYKNASEGNIYINEKLFKAELLYDIYNDDLICLIGNSSGNRAPVIVNNLAVGSFSLGGRDFINFPYQHLNLNGYYELIYDGGNFKLLAKWFKKTTSDVNQNKIKKFMKEKKHLVLVNNSKSEVVRTRRAFVKFFNLTKKEARLKYKHPVKNLQTATNTGLIDFAKSFN